MCKKRESDAQNTVTPKTTKRPEKTQTPKPRKLTYKENQELQSIEDVILAAETEKEEVEREISDPATYKFPNKIKELNTKLDELTQHIDALYARWEYLTKVSQGQIIE